MVILPSLCKIYHVMLPVLVKQKLPNTNGFTKKKCFGFEKSRQDVASLVLRIRVKTQTCDVLKMNLGV
jgi:hypothetical protein